MKAKFNSAWIAVKAFVKKNAFSCACFLLAAAIFVTGSVSYAKYVTNSSVGGGASAGSFSVDATIDGVSALSFTNTEFWGTSSATGEQVAMNALHSVNFSVRNYEPDSNGNATKVSATRMKYNLVFSAPVNFAEKLALQVFDEYNAPMMPQIVVADLISAGENDTTFDTSNSTDYNGTNFADMKFTVTKNSDGYVATSGKNVIRLQKYQKEVEQSLMFRMWDTSALTSTSNPKFDHECGQLQTPLTATYKTNVDYYRIVITLENFVLPAGTAKQAKHSVHLAPVGTVDDNYIGSTFVTLQKDISGNITGFEPITEIYGGTDEVFTLMNVKENVTDTYYADGTFSGTPTGTQTSNSSVSGLPTTYTPGENLIFTSSTSQSDVSQSWEEGNYHEYTVKATSETEIKLNNPTVEVSNLYPQPTANGYQYGNTSGFVPLDSSNYIGTAKRTSGSPTTFYIYKVPVICKGSSTYTVVETKKVIGSRSVTQSNSRVTEENIVKSVNSNGTVETININVVRTTETKDVGTENQIQTTVTTTIYTRTYTHVEGYIYGAYYFKSGTTYESNDPLTVYYGDDLKMESAQNGSPLENNQVFASNVIVEKIDSNSEAYADTQTTQSVDNQTPQNDQPFTETTITTEYFTREIKRTYTYTEVQLTDVTWSKRDENGDIVKEKNEISVLQSYTKGDPLNFYTKESGVLVQKLYLSESYSKEYPFFVNVVFEQVLE